LTWTKVQGPRGAAFRGKLRPRGVWGFMWRMTAFGAALALALMGLPVSGGAAETVSLQLGGPPQFEFAGYYAALWQGFYRDAGLDVTIRPSGLKPQTTIDPVREVTEGRAQFGVGTMQLVIRRAQGLPVLLVAPIFQQSGATIYYRADSDFSSPAALVNARLGRLPASDVLDIELATALRGEGLDPAKIKAVSIEAKQVVPALGDKTVDAGIGSAWIVPWQAHERGLVLKSFNPANYRVEYYGDSLFTMQRFEAAEPETVARFRAASLKGWEYALQHPDAVITRLASEKTTEPAAADINGLNRYQADVARRLARYPDIPLGYSNGDRWTQIEAGMVGAGVLQHAESLSDFIYRPQEPAPGHGLSGLSGIVGLGVAAAVAAAAGGSAVWLAARLWRRRAPARTPQPRPAPPEPVPQREPAPVLALRRVPARPRPPPTDLNTVLAPLERSIQRRVRGKVRLRFSLLPELWPCRTEDGAVAAVVLDLVDAAIAAMTSDGALIVGTRNFTFSEDNIDDLPGGRLGDFARITIRDNGPGLGETEYAQITDLATTTRPAIPRAVAAMHRLGGFVRVESAEDIGTAVHLYFARVEDRARSPHPEIAASAPAAEVAE
jgi:ABC-type nitrate/sulfonate/bicarbonate transport system substrate-binding protein